MVVVHAGTVLPRVVLEVEASTWTVHARAAAVSMHEHEHERKRVAPRLCLCGVLLLQGDTVVVHVWQTPA